MSQSPLYPFFLTLDRMHRRLVSLIQSSHFLFELPKLSSMAWGLIVDNGADRERLEFLGDALIGSTISQMLYHRWPNEDPRFYTNTRAVLTANSTFAHLMFKVGLYDITSPVKPAGDAFETILAIYHRERGPAAFDQYINQYFIPLLDAAAVAYRNLGMDVMNPLDRIQRRIRHHNLSASTLPGNIKVGLPLKFLKEYTRVGPRRQQIMKTNIMSTPGHINHNLANSSTNVAINRPVADVIDLTSESDENEQIQCFCLNQIGSHPQATVDVAFLQHILQDLAVVSSSPEEGYELTHLHPNSRSGIKGQTSSPSISALPREEGKAEDPCRLENGRGTSTENNDDLLVPFSQVSLAGHLGSINNPITID